MANWAIVIGIDQYWTEKACLKGAVRDALRMREWLLDTKGGNVHSRNLLLLLDPSLSNPAPANLRHHEATQEKILEVIKRLVDRSGGQGERLFFHYSGHGLTARINFSDEQALVMADVTDLLTTRSLGLRSILEYFEAVQFQEQFFFIDACRNIPWEGEFEIGKMPRPRRRDPRLPAIQQFVFYATSPGVKAAELREAGNERGAFTDALLDGLKGAGKAKAWDMEYEEYVVRVNRLFQFVLAEVNSRRLAVNDATANQLFQVPRLGGERGAVGESDPILARFPDDAFPKATLEVFVDPSTIASPAEVTVVREGALVASQTQITGLPVQFTLPPKEYSVRAAALNHEPKQKRWYVELYQPLQVTVSLTPAARPAVLSEPTGTRDLDVGSGPATMIVESGDCLAALEVADNTGNILKVGQGRLEYTDLTPGFYRARLQTPEGQVVEQMLELSPGETETVHLDAPKQPVTRVAQDVIEHADFNILPDNTMEVSETSGIGAIASAQLSTILTLAGSVATYDTSQLSAHRLRSLGLKAFQEKVTPGAPSGLQILFGFESGSPAQARKYLSGTKLRLWPQDQPIPRSSQRLVVSSAVDGLAEFASAAQPGPHWLSVEIAKQKPVVFALAMLPQRLTMLVFHWTVEGQIRVFQYIPSLVPDNYSKPADLRRLELIQRFYLSGRLDHTYESTKDLLYAKWADPIAGCLGGYLVLRLGKPAELDRAARNMRDFFGKLSDSHVLMAEYAASLQRDGYLGEDPDQRAASEFRQALDQGLPIFAEGLARLSDGVQRYNIDHPRVALLEAMLQKSVPGLLWSAWTPQSLLPGKVLGAADLTVPGAD